MSADAPNDTLATAGGVSGITIRLWLVLAVAIAAILAANAHLVYIAIRSQPDCVAHVVQGEGSEGGRFSAAQSSCAPPPTRAGQS